MNHTMALLVCLLSWQISAQLSERAQMGGQGPPSMDASAHSEIESSAHSEMNNQFCSKRWFRQELLGPLLRFR